ncbi:MULTISPECIES: succinate dehydrogenase assembly factor 2 [Silvimonas]|uniref:FAD assembly factor SdhE n=1 Tax=Silvimonas TaxID=300264 RepID=UPI0024B371B7|nr:MULTISPECIES: succinate dehydrogenase assembly factor 2 [Silvimonas]MDR3428468.1 succinate dehydrogenase assembly factor 2 [Silvimonas sp.]
MDEIEKKRIVWRSRRGLLELDIQLERFVRDVLPGFSEADWTTYAQMLLLSDNDLLDYLNGKAQCPDQRLVPMIERVGAHR